MEENSEQLFLVEVLVDTIVLSDINLPPKKQIIVNVNFEGVVSLEIRAEGVGAMEKEERGSYG